MAGRSRLRLLMRTRSAATIVADVAGGLVAAAAGVAIGVLVLMLIGLGVRALCELAGMPLPSVHDDPDRVEWGGLALPLRSQGFAANRLSVAAWLLT